jgi:precorrin-6A/cobalt-precorrin-6A reductase
MFRLLLLGGTGDAAGLAARLSNHPEITCLTSLAGRTRSPRPLLGPTRTGGFGGVDGLEAFLREQRIDLVVDATHPFARQIGANALAACNRLGVARLRLCRPSWRRDPADRWFEVEDTAAAAAALPGLGRRIFLTSGQEGLHAFAGLLDIWFLVRTVEPPVDLAALPQARWLEARGPFRREDERALMRRERIDALVTKASGGAATYGKIEAARELGLPVVMIRRPPPLPGPVVESVEAALAWIESCRRRRSGEA